ncbi:hypothetical protein BDA99DRAFT_522929 [Phascolomyces articulosus]|uniref:Transmembrane protein n=1 Tax=Phascolomyces articulosus TaxID=60185 RepID=A0AAD5K1S0_9FUNG|nr:hypothetical protein BDA99DRAFT_522929 [Phascolomyces articulosus]
MSPIMLRSLARQPFQRRWTSTTSKPTETVIYTGPLANVAKKLKLFSVTSLGLGTGISPFVFVIDVPVPFIAKAALVGAAVATSAASTGLIQWVMSPYVTKISQNNTNNELTIHTLSFLAKDHQTKVPVESLGPATRIFTSLMVMDPSTATAQVGGKPTKPKTLFYVHPELCEEEDSAIKTVIDKTGIGKGF